MSEQKDYRDEDAPHREADAAEAQDTANEAESGWAGGEAAEDDVLNQLQEENGRLKDQLLRTLAEMENLRRRTEREVREANAYGISGFARDVMEVSDNLRRALDAVPAEAKANADPALSGLLEGVEMTERELLKVFEKHGVQKLDPAGERFDPNFHQAMFEIEDASVASGTVLQVVQAGYVIGERVLRPALVGVSKGGPRQPKAEAAETANETSEPSPLDTDDGADTAAGPGAGPSATGEGEGGPGPRSGPGAARPGGRIDKSA